MSGSASGPIAGGNHVSTSTCAPVQAQARVIVHAEEPPALIPVPGAAGPPPHPSAVWAKTLEIAKKSLSDKNLPSLDITNLTSQPAGKNIDAVVGALNTLQEDAKKKRWSYTWCGKEVIVVERLGRILKFVEKYSMVVDFAVQSNPQVSALVWAGVWAITRVRI